MKLTIEHLAPYLPYNLNAEIKKKKYPYTKDRAILTGHHIDIIYLYDIKPILRPLSDLTKEIEHNGERFVPMHIFFQENGGGYEKYEYFETHELFTYTQLKSLYFTDAQKLFEWHFDVFGLIDEGLATDINKLK